MTVRRGKAHVAELASPGPDRTAFEGSGRGEGGSRSNHAPILMSSQPSTSSREPISEATSLMEVISRAAADPATDVEKLERLLSLYHGIKADAARAAYMAALAEMQPEVPTVIERGEIKISKEAKGQSYALFEDINAAVRPILAKHGFAISFRTGREDGHIVVTGILSHRSGHSEQTMMHLPVDTSGSKNAVQAIGSSTSYGRRYVLCALLNIATTGEDDDGFAGGSKRISEAQVDALSILANSVGADKRKFCDFMGVSSIAEIPASQYARAKQALAAKGQRAIP